MSEYKKEFFDRDYSAKEAYGRVWDYAKKYRLRIFLGILCGMLTAGTFLPLFQVIQPTLGKVSENEARMVAVQNGPPPGAKEVSPSKNKLERQLQKASKLPSWYPQVERLASKVGIKVQDESGAMGGAMVLIIVLVVPLVALARLATLFLSNYCLTWAGSHVVADLRVDMLRHIQRQSMQFHG
jgi:ABC-type multidrug transport system fused ATPase/permease subunit